MRVSAVAQVLVLLQWVLHPFYFRKEENEYGQMEYELGAPGRAYATLAANMAVSLKTGVPWVTCKQEDAPDPVINSCMVFTVITSLPTRITNPSYGQKLGVAERWIIHQLLHVSEFGSTAIDLYIKLLNLH
ncbi:hypothetical protein MRB53_021601 [Persea americana]|uniref:Uncharacterized protein n=1 Tax=Persea americana TaxID=3435 RepID=A0ACC2L4E7_PERAE|nr:hypothetical protein MRB53_021601 [Persea americana]